MNNQFNAVERGITIFPWNACNAQCAHCSQNSAPTDNTYISHDKMLSLIKEASEVYGAGWCLALSGGEVFLDYQRLVEYVKAVSNHDGVTNVITNCYWASSVERALELLKPLVSNNLRLLGISTDLFHKQFVSTDKIINAIQAAKLLNLPVNIRVVSTKSHRLSNILMEIERCEPWFVRFIEMPIIPVGRGSNLQETEFFLSDSLPEGTCRAPELAINSYGDAMICCNGGGDYKSLQLGNIANHKLSVIEEKFNNNKIIDFLVNKGPAKTLDFLDQPEKNWVESQKYVNVCHLCIKLFSTQAIANKITTAILRSYC